MEARVLSARRTNRQFGFLPVESRFSDNSSKYQRLKCVFELCDTLLEYAFIADWLAVLMAKTGALMYTILAENDIM